MKGLGFLWRFLIFLFLLASLSLGFIRFAAYFDAASQPTRTDPAPERIHHVVLDAGHGGEDGGAVGKNGGAVEKEINLKITFFLKELLEANGIRVTLTRDTDVLLYDKSSNYHGQKKIQDLEARRKIAESNPNAFFISIHMNTYPLDSCRGLQVWYSPNDKRSHDLAEAVRESARQCLDPKNHRQTKRAGSSIYLLHRLTTPAILVECGFLSNPEEEALLSSEEYQKKVAFALFLSIVQAEFESAET